jgi:hypothetical protein
LAERLLRQEIKRLLHMLVVSCVTTSVTQMMIYMLAGTARLYELKNLLMVSSSDSSLHCGESILVKRSLGGWEYWSHHSVGDLQLFAYRRYVFQGDDDARSVIPHSTFQSLIYLNPHFDFN